MPRSKRLMLPMLRAHIKAHPGLKRLFLTLMRCFSALSWKLNPASLIRYIGFFSDLRKFRLAGGKAGLLDLYPCLNDRQSSTGIDTHYFHQAIWAFRQIKDSGVSSHVDIASDVNFVGLLTTITQVLFVDFRPLFLSIPNYQGIGATITQLPFKDASVESVSCLHVIEHVGLGRYGDPLNPAGAETACREISRILKPGGHAYISVPVGRPRISFNGLRVFSTRELMNFFGALQLVDAAMVDVPGRFSTVADPLALDIREADGGLDFGLGMFHFTKVH